MSDRIPASAPGVTSTKIYAGFGFSSDVAAASRAIGASGAATSYDARAVFNAVTRYANTHGGFAGRQLVPVFYDYRVFSQDTSDQQDQAACSLWTQDNKVFAMPGTGDVLRACAEKAQVVSIGGGEDVLSTFRRFPHYVAPTTVRLDRLGPVTVNGLYRAGYFAGKLGLVSWDEPNYRYALANGYLPALAAHNIKPTETAYIMVPQGMGALGDMTAAVAAAVNKFKGLGIDHVIIQDGPAGVFGGTGLTLEWMNQAESQRYYPRYGQNSNNTPGSEVLPPSQQDRAVAVSQLDLDRKYDDGWRPNAAREKCFKIQSDAGLPVGSANKADEAVAAKACDFVFFLQQVVNRLSAISADSFIRGVATLSTSFASAYVYGTKLIPGRRDGGDLHRIADYSASCRCLKFRGPPFSPD